MSDILQSLSYIIHHTCCLRDDGIKGRRDNRSTALPVHPHSMSGDGDKPSAIIFGALPHPVLFQSLDPSAICHRWPQHLFSRPRRLPGPPRRRTSRLGMFLSSPICSHPSNIITAPTHRGQVFRVPSHNVSALVSAPVTTLILVHIAILEQNFQKFCLGQMSSIARPTSPSRVSCHPSE